MKEVWQEILSEIGPGFIKWTIRLGIFSVLVTLGLLYVFS